MKHWYKLVWMAWFICFPFLESNAMLAVPYAKHASCPEDSNVIAHEIRQQLSDEVKYIKQFSGSASEDGMLHGSLTEYDAQLVSINQLTKKDDVKVYVILINGLSLVDYQTVPDAANDVTKVLDWSKNRKTIESISKSYVAQEAKKIIEQITAQQAAIADGPAVFCSLVEFEVKYGQDKDQTYKGKKVTVYHSTAYGFSDTESYLKELDALVSQSTWTNSPESNLNQLIKCIRVRTQAYTKDKIDARELDDLMKKLAASNSKMEVSQYLDQLSDKNLMNRFDDPLRAHVIRVLLGSDESSGIATGGITVYNKVLNAEKNALLVLERIDAVNIDSWFTYINTSHGAAQTTLQFITKAVSRKFFGESGYTSFTIIINRQLGYFNDFNAKEKELLTDESKADHILVWDKSYALKLLKTAPVNTNTYEVELQSDGKLRLTKSVVRSQSCVPVSGTFGQGGTTVQMGEFCVANWEKEPAIFLDPFDLIGFVNRSDLSLLTDKASLTDEITIVPALHLLYAQEKEFNDNVGESFSLAGNLLTIALPISKLTYAPSLAQKIIYGIELSDKVASVASVSITLGIDGKNYNDIVKAYSDIQTFLSHGLTVYQIAQSTRAKNLANYVAAVTKHETELKVLANQSEEVRYVLALKEKIDREGKALKGDDWVKQYGSILSSAGLTAQAGKVINGGENLLELKSIATLFRPLGNKQNPMKAGDFWRNTSLDVNHYISKDGKYYVKHNTKTQQVLFIELGSEPKFLGYGIDEASFIKGNYETLIQNLKTIHGLPGGSSTITIHGETIKLSSEKMNFILGKYNPNHVFGVSGEIGTNDILEELSVLKNYAFAEESFTPRPGSICILNIPKGMYNKENDFFDDFNVDYLEQVIKNKEEVEIVFVSDPRKYELLSEFDKGQIIFTNKPSGLAKEVRYLRDRGITKVKFKDGTTIDLTEIDLSKLQWTAWKY